MSPSKLTVEAWPVTHAGRAEENEDFVLVHQPTDERQARLSGSLYIVADGVGGGQRGQIASRYAAQRVMHAYYESDEPDLGLRLKESILQANADLFAYAQERPELVKIGTTLVAAAVRGEQLHVASVGDSRAYLVREGVIRQITQDHTLVQQLLDEGAIDESEVADHPRRDVVLRTLGAAETISVDMYDARLSPDDALILCSDGLTHALHNDEIAAIVGEKSPRDAAETLVQKATDRGTKDNITVVTALLRDGAPPVVRNMPHAWDGGMASFDAQPTLAVPIIPRPDISAEETIAAAAPVVVSPVETPQKPAPGFEQAVKPAPEFGGAEPRIPSPVGYLSDMPIDPETGLPPIPQDQLEQPGRPSQPVYQPRIYRPPTQPSLRRGARQGIGIGAVLGIAAIALALVALMLLLLINPFDWNLPFGGADVAATGTTTQVPATPVPPTQTLPAVVTDEPTAETAEPTDAPTATPDVALLPIPPGMILVDGGVFQRGVTDDEAETAVETCVVETAGEDPCYREYFFDAQPVEQVTLSPFYIDLTEVTNSAYAECVTAGTCTPPGNIEFFADPAFGQHPVVHVDYAQSAAYCSWQNRRLPTEAEWEKAARWDQAAQLAFVYPWGDNFEDGIANTFRAGLGGLSSVQAFARDLSAFGVFGLGGNASEWVQDWYFDSYDGLGTLNPVRLGAQPLPDPYRVVRGGNYELLPHFVRSGHRLDMPPTTQVAWLGFRCAANATGAQQPAAATATPDAAADAPTATP